MSSVQEKHIPPRSSKSPSPSQQQQRAQSTASYFTYPVSHVVSGLYRRLTETASPTSSAQPPRDHVNYSGVFTPPRRTASPFQPPPLTPLTLKSSPCTSHQLLTRSLAEEIRLLIPPRLQLLDTWQLAYSLDRDGSSLSTLYEKCKAYASRSQRAGYVLVVKDASSPSGGSPTGSNGALFGAYLSDPPHPDAHYYGTGECFLWRASTAPGAPIVRVDANGQTISDAGKDRENRNRLHPHESPSLSGLPSPPGADTTNLRGRNTTSRGESKSGTSTPDQIRFKAFPYSGINDYMIFCEAGFLSVGGGDGHFGLWLDDSFQKGVSSPCQTFGNEPLSDEGTKFDILGVELWYLGS
ncbi:hypothetical protein VTO42DRAFT_3507 [Malbranchea cinnamomea]